MRPSSWPVMTAGSIDSGSAPLRITRSARSSFESHPAARKRRNNPIAPARQRRITARWVIPTTRKFCCMTFFFNVRRGYRCGEAEGAGDACAMLAVAAGEALVATLGEGEAEGTGEGEDPGLADLAGVAEVAAMAEA